MKKTKAEKFKFLPSSKSCLFPSFTNNTFSKYLAPCMSMTEQIHCLLQNVDELLIGSRALASSPCSPRRVGHIPPPALSTPLQPECRLSGSPVVLQQAAHKDLLGTSTAGYEELNGKEKNPNTMKEQKKNVEGNL